MQRQQSKVAINLSHAAGIFVCLAFIAWSSNFEDGALRFTLADDAMISMTYARTLADTGQFVWYPGAETVQGISNLLWAGVMAIVHWLGFNGPIAALVVSLAGIIIIALTAQVAGLIAKDLLPAGDPGQRSARLMTIGLIYLSYPLVFWTLRGFEVGLIALLTVCLIRALQSNHEVNLPKAGIAVALLITIGIFTRLDFAVISLGISLATLAFSRKTHERSARYLALIGIGATSLALLIVFAFQLATWGDVLPNTYYLKATGIETYTQLERGVLSTLKSTPLFVLASYSLSRIWKEKETPTSRRTALSMASTSFSLVVYAIYVGGDVWDDFLFANRFLTPALPLVAIALAVLSQLLIRTKSLDKTSYKWFILMVFTATLTGVTTNNDASIERTLVMPLLVGLAALIPTLVSLIRKDSQKIRRFVLAYISLPAVFLLLTSFSGFASALHFGKPQGVSAELTMIQNGYDIAAVTTSEARVLVAWAGIPAYFSERPAIDLLGKSDKRIASLNPPTPIEGTWNEKFVPGHNKWDFQISVIDSMPDLIFQFMDHPGERSRLTDLGYKRACLPNTGYEVWYLGSSTAVVAQALSFCDQE